MAHRDTDHRDTDQQDTDQHEQDGPDQGRRALLRRLGTQGAAAAGLAAGATLATARPAGAITGEPLTLGRVGNNAGGATTAVYTGASTTAHAFTFADNSGAVSTATGAATLVGHASALGAGVLGASTARGGTGVTGSAEGVDGVAVRATAPGPGGTAVTATGGTAGVVTTMSPADDTTGLRVVGARRGLVTSATTTFPLSLAPGTHTTGAPAAPAVVGDVTVDASGTIWVCVTAGSPGRFRRLGGTATAGSFTAVQPTRVHDTRKGSPPAGAIGGGRQRLVAVARGINPSTGALLSTDLVPAGATAVSCNVTVLTTTGSGSLAVVPGDATGATTTTVGWTAAGQQATSGLIVRLDTSRRIKVVASGSGTAHYLVDVTGYWL